MKQEFIQKVIKNEQVDTKDYRYKTFEAHDGERQYRIIKRIPISALGTTAALSENWETIWTEKR